MILHEHFQAVLQFHTTSEYWAKYGPYTSNINMIYVGMVRMRILRKGFKIDILFILK